MFWCAPYQGVEPGHAFRPHEDVLVQAVSSGFVPCAVDLYCMGAVDADFKMGAPGDKYIVLLVCAQRLLFVVSPLVDSRLRFAVFQGVLG